MPWYRTVYKHDWEPAKEPDSGKELELVGHFCGNIRAKSLKDARSCAKARGMGEYVEPYIKPTKKRPYKPASKVLSGRAALREKFHALCYLGQLALASGVAQPWEIVGDRGIIHRFSHGEGGSKSLMAEIRRIEGLVPGYN